MDRNRLVVLLVLIVLVSTSSFTISSPFLNTEADSKPVDVHDITPPVAEAGPDQIVDEDTMVTFDASGSTDDVGIVNYTWSFIMTNSTAEPQNKLVLPFPVADVVFDPRRPYAYLSDQQNNRVHFLNLTTDTIEKVFSLSLPPESLAIDPNADTLFVALLTREHSSYWRDEDGHEGYIARYDLNLQVKQNEFHITEDPYDIVATSDGHIVVSSGSGQWTYARVYDALTGAETAKIYSIRQRTHLALHPSETKVYGADTDSHPSDIERYNLLPGGGIEYAWDSIYHGDHRMWGNIWASPRGDVVITRGGDVFKLGNTRSTDMLFYKPMAGNAISHLAFDNETQMIFTAEMSNLYYYDLDTYRGLGSQSFGGEAKFIGLYGQSVYGLLEEGSQTTIVKLPHPKTSVYGKIANHVFTEPGYHVITLTVKDAAGNSDTDTLTVAVLDKTPPVAEAGDDITVLKGEMVQFDGSASSDNTGIVKHTWTFTDDTQQTLNGQNVDYRFYDSGIYNVTLTVEDSEGNIGTDDLTVRVNPIQLVTRGNTEKGFHIGIPQDWDVRIDFEVPEVGVVDLAAFGPMLNQVETNVVVVSETEVVRETDGFLIAEAEEGMVEIEQELGPFNVIRQPEIIETNNSRAAVFEIQYTYYNMRQIIALVVNESQSRLWVIVITVGPGYNQTMSLTFDAIIESFDVVQSSLTQPPPPPPPPEPPAILPPTSEDGLLFTIVVAVVCFVVGILLGVFLGRRRNRQPSPEEPTDVTPESVVEAPQPQPIVASPATSTLQRINRYCTSCGAELTRPYKFCQDCGSKVS